MSSKCDSNRIIIEKLLLQSSKMDNPEHNVSAKYCSAGLKQIYLILYSAIYYFNSS